MSEQPEILNIDYHVKRMIVKALNRTDTNDAAAKALGISTRTLYRLKKDYNVCYNHSTDEFFITENNNPNAAGTNDTATA